MLKKINFFFKFFFKILSSKEKKFIFLFLGLILICLLSLGIKVYFEKTETIPIRGGQYTEGMNGNPTYLNPLLCQTSQIDQDLTSLIFRSLFRFDKEKNIVSDLAQGYEISEDKKTYTISLKENQLWEDNQKIEADDLVFTIENIQSPVYRSPLAINFKGVKIEKIDNSKVKFTLRDSYPNFLENLTFGILPKHIWQDVELKNVLLSEFNLKPVGSGPFKVIKLTKDKKGFIKSIVLTPLSAQTGLEREKFFLEKITFKFYSDYQSLINAYLNKEILGISFFKKEDKEKLNKKPINIYSLKLPQYTALFFNPEKKEILKNKNIRQALSLMTDRKKIVGEVLQNEGIEISVPFLEENNFDFGKAEEILEKEGWKKNEKGIRIKDGKELELILSFSDWPEFSKIGEILKEEWKKAGINLQVKTFSLGEFQEKSIKPRDYQILLFSQILGHSMDFYPFWHSQEMKDPGLNLSLISDKKIDEIIEKMRSEQDKGKKEEFLKEFQKTLKEENIAIFLYQPNYLYPISKKIKGFDLKKIVNPSERFIGMEKWYVKTKRVFSNK